MCRSYFTMNCSLVVLISTSVETGLHLALVIILLYLSWSIPYCIDLRFFCRCKVNNAPAAGPYHTVLT